MGSHQVPAVVRVSDRPMRCRLTNRGALRYTLAACLFLQAGGALAQSQPAPVADPELDAQIEEIVVTGTANAGGVSKQKAPYAITALDQDAIKDAAPTSAADLVKLVPGLFAETTSGVSGPNIEVRGYPTAADAPFVTMQLNGLPIFPVATLSFLDNSTQLRVDETVKRVEATIGGPAVLWGNGQPGATINWIEKNGRTDADALVRATVGNGNLYRVDGYVGGKIAEGWYASVGGFYRINGGIRDTQFPADKGYQVVATLTRDLGDGELNLYGRKTRDRNAFFTPIPLINSGTAADPKLSGFPGFNPLTATFLGNANRLANYDVGPGGQTRRVDLADGRGIDNQVIGANFNYRFGAVTVTNKAAYIWGSAPNNDQFTGASPTTLGNFITDRVAAANANATVVGAAGVATGGTARFVGGDAITNLNLPVIGIGVWYVDKRVKAFQDELRVQTEVFEGNSLTIGAYVSDFSSRDVWNLGNTQIMALEKNARPIVVALNNGVRATNADGIYAPSFYSINNRYHGTNVAGILSDHWKITPRLTIDAGLRFEKEWIDATIGNTTTGFIGSDARQLYNYGANYVTTGSTSRKYDTSAVAYTVDAGYQLADRLDAFVGYNRGYILPTFDDVRSGVTRTTYVDQLQAGIKRGGSLYSVYLTAFYNWFTGQPSQQILADGSILNYVTSSRTKGVELQAAIRPFTGAELSADATYQDGNYSAGGPGITGSQILRQPAFQLRVTPSYQIPLGTQQVRVFGAVTYIGKRFADLQNQQVLPAYTTLDLGVDAKLSDQIELRLSGTNVTNTLGITEGNPRIIGTGVAAGGVFLGRPLFGATYQGSVTVHF